MSNEDAPGVPPFAGQDAETAIREHWDDLIADMEATAAEFREAGWEPLELHPGDVTIVTDSHRGFDVLVPDDEFNELAAWVDQCSFSDHDIYRAEAGITFTLLVLKAPDAERAVCCPLYYDDEGLRTLGRLADENGELWTHVRRLSEEFVHFCHDHPAPFFPEA
jgi:hypothetical protein